METITIEGMDEHDFRYRIEDMLRAGKVDEAVEQLRAMLEPYTKDGGILPRRFAEVTAEDVRLVGWQKLGERLGDHDRPFRPISAIGICMCDYRNTGGPGPSYGRLAPFMKTFYFSDEAYPFSDSTRDDLLDGYTRDGFGWQGDYQATDASIAIRGIDDLYGAIVELENRLFESGEPSDEEIHSGTVGACFIWALIHQVLRNAVREEGLPRPLCVLAACDGVFPYFDAPVAGLDECRLAETDEESKEAAPVSDEPVEEFVPAEELFADFSRLNVVSRKTAKTMVLALNDDEVEEAARQNERASAQRMVGDDDDAIEELLHVAHEATRAVEITPEKWAEEEWSEEGLRAEPPADSPPADKHEETDDFWPHDIPELDESPDEHRYGSMRVDFASPQQPVADMDAEAGPGEDGFADGSVPEPSPIASPSSHSLRAKIRMSEPEPQMNPASRSGILGWIMRVIFRR